MFLHRIWVGEMEGKSLGAGSDSDRDFFGIGGGHQEDDMLGRLFQSF